MDALFGIPMNIIMIVLVCLLVVALGSVAYIALRNRIFFIMGLRNIPRRTAQTVLIVVGLMLSTLIISAAFGTGDTVDYSITNQAFTLLGHVDVELEQRGGGRDISADQYKQFQAALNEGDYPNIDGSMGVLFEEVPVSNRASGLSEPLVTFAGLDEAALRGFPDVVSTASGQTLDVASLVSDEAYMNESAADELGVSAGDSVQVFVDSAPYDFTIVDVVEDRYLTGAFNEETFQGMVTRLITLHEIFEHDQISFIDISARGGVRDTLDLTDGVESDVERLIGENELKLDVQGSKREAVEFAELFGNFMTTFFLLMGLFSIGAGILLIVMIFVMLAAERKSEMGMARAVGTKRLHLTEMFLAEGTAYNLGAAVVGVVLGIAFAFGLAVAAGGVFAAFGISFTPHVTLRTAVISFSLGVVLTFFTVAFSSWRVSNLNIVRAIRDIPEPTNRRMGWRGLLAWVLLIAFGALNFWLGISSNAAFPFALGFTLITCGAAVLSTHFGVPARPAYTGMGLFLLLFWGLTAGDRLEPIFGKLSGDIEMFFLSGVAMVTASTFVIIYNADILLPVISRVGGLFGPVLPAVRTAVAYPMANRFRTGMTLAMISLVVFSLTMMSTMNLNYDKLFLNDESRGGWDIEVVENPNNPIPSLAGTLGDAGAPVAQEIRAEGAVLIAGFDSATEVSQGAPDDAPGAVAWEDYPVQGLTDGFVENGDVPLGKIANGYEDADAVWEALRTESDVAIIDGFTIEGGFGPGSEFQLDGLADAGDTFDAPTITIRDSATGESRDVRVIGIIAFGASSNFFGIYVGEDAFRDVFGEPEASVHYVALTNPDDSRAAANKIEAALVTSGAQADSLQEIADEENALSRSFLYLMQAFMGLGLLVGIAAVGVIAFRTVVERRQQIGMLRAIGYKRNTVALSFLLESSFVTILGVTSGILLGLWLAYFLVTGDDFPAEGQAFHVPWMEITIIGVFTLLASLLMTWIPSRQAAGVPTAEALRYE